MFVHQPKSFKQLWHFFFLIFKKPERKISPQNQLFSKTTNQKRQIFACFLSLKAGRVTCCCNQTIRLKSFKDLVADLSDNHLTDLFCQLEAWTTHLVVFETLFRQVHFYPLVWVVGRCCRVLKESPFVHPALVVSPAKNNTLWRLKEEKKCTLYEIYPWYNH